MEFKSNSELSSERAKEVANIIRQQLGGNQTMAMIGGKNLYAVDYQCGGLQFDIKAKNNKKINRCIVVLNGTDTYDMEFGYVRAGKYTKRKSYDGVYCDQIRDLIEDATGLYTRF